MQESCRRFWYNTARPQAPQNIIEVGPQECNYRQQQNCGCHDSVTVQLNMLKVWATTENVETPIPPPQKT